MTTVILVTIGIILAAASALMVVFYGGEGFTSGQVKARALTLENAADNIETAMAGRKFNRIKTLPNQLSDLVTDSNWLSQLPDVNGAEAGTPTLLDDNGQRLYVVPGVSQEVCNQVNVDYYGEEHGIRENRGSDRRGCYHTPSDDYVFYTVIGDM